MILTSFLNYDYQVSNIRDILLYKTETAKGIYIYIYIKNQQSPISPHNFVYFIRFYRFHCSNRFSRRRQVVNIATMRNDVIYIYIYEPVVDLYIRVE